MHGTERSGVCRGVLQKSRRRGREQSRGRPLKPLQGVRTFSLRVIGNHEGCVGSNAMGRFTFGADLSSCGLDDNSGARLEAGSPGGSWKNGNLGMHVELLSKMQSSLKISVCGWKRTNCLDSLGFSR